MKPDTSPEALAYMKAMHPHTMTADKVENRIPEARPGQIDQSKLTLLQDTFNKPREGKARTNPEKPGEAIPDLRSTIDRSNEAYHTRGENYALVELNMRSSNSPEARANKGFQGNAMMGVIEDYATSDQNVEYIRQMLPLLGQADVFKDNPQNLMDFIMKGQLNVASHTEVGKQQDTYKNGEAATGIPREAVRTLVFLPSLPGLSEEDIQSLPPAHGICCSSIEP